MQPYKRRLTLGTPFQINNKIASMSELINVRLKRDVNFQDIEELASTIINSHDTKIQIPNALSYSGGFGMESAALQLLATWLRCSTSHILHTAVQENNASNFEELCNSFFGLSSLRLADQIWLADREQIDLAIALKPAVPIFEKIRNNQFSGAFKGMYLTIPSIKSPVIKGGKDREFDNPLYSNNNVIGAKQFHQITSKALEVIAPQLVIKPHLITHVSEILRELFTNTHKHARTDVDGNPLAKNFRGIIFNNLNLNASRFSEIAKSGGANLALFHGEWRPKEDKIFRALDITIIDSGPGYARRWAKMDKDRLTPQLEKEAVLQCFTKHQSTDTIDSSGSGLSNVLLDLKSLRGWMRLRTGRILIEKYYFDHLGSETIDPGEIRERDDFLEGVVFNIVIPFESLQGEY